MYRSHSRFIPALAGNTAGCRSEGCAVSVHPRAGGEHRPRVGWIRLYCGSSPRWRGTPMARIASLWYGRFIPALAGNTTTKPSTRASSPVHPRAGGEHSGDRRASSPPVGSSPRWRGTLEIGRQPHTVNRFIPALAGNTSSPLPLRPTISVHPRAGGEHIAHCSPQEQIDGSSPRWRGTRTRPRSEGDGLRFIPALAGNTLPATA